MAWPPTVAQLRQEVQTEAPDAALYRALQNAVEVVDRYNLSDAQAEHHALQLAVVDVRFAALSSRTDANGAKVEHDHAAARQYILVELGRLRLVKLRRNGGPAPPTVPAAPERVVTTTPVRYLSFDEWKTRALSTTLPLDADGQINRARAELLLDDAAAWCAGIIPGNLTRGGYLLLPADVSVALLAVVKQVSSDLVSMWLSPRHARYGADCEECEKAAAVRLKATAQSTA